jgi:hypothetical protein
VFGGAKAIFNWHDCPGAKVIGATQLWIEKASLGAMVADSTVMPTPAMLVTLITWIAGLEPGLITPKSTPLGEMDRGLDPLFAPVVEGAVLIPLQEMRSGKKERETRRSKVRRKDRFLGPDPGKGLVILLPPKFLQ